MNRPGATSCVFLKIFWPHHFSSRSGVGGRLPMNGPERGVSIDRKMHEARPCLPIFGV